ncbi:MAG: radical SAM protein [Fibrobacter sp.]|nr:radical SAM protein [Fibrobacter sp.]
MKITFLNPPFHSMFSRESRSPSVTKSSTLYWPMFLSYAAGNVEADNNEIQLIDSPAMDLDLDATIAKIREFTPELIILSTSTPSILNDLQVAKTLKVIFGVPTAIMGTHASAEPIESMELEPSLDYCIIGEADHTAKLLVRHLRGEIKEVSSIPGLAFRTPDGGVDFQPEGPKIENLDSIPWVSKVYKNHLYPYYKRYFYGANINPLIVILSGRGCPHRCSYCVIPQTINGHVFRTRSPQDVVDELVYITENFEDLGEVFFEDDTFTAKHQHVKTICNLILERKLKITWSCNARADVPLDLLKLMKKAGCREMCVGFESASPEVLQNINKGVKNTDNALRFAENAKKAGILVHGCFMVGNLGDTPETLELTLEYAKKLNPNTAQFYPIMAYPGTEAYKEAIENNALETRDYNQWLDKDGFHRTTIRRENLSSQDLVDFCDRARREFYLRPQYILQQAKMALLNKRERYRIFRGFGTLVKHLFRKHGEVASHTRQAPTNKS